MKRNVFMAWLIVLLVLLLMVLCGLRDSRREVKNLRDTTEVYEGIIHSQDVYIQRQKRTINECMGLTPDEGDQNAGL